MNIKFLGSILIVLSCGGFGFVIAASHKKETYTLGCLIRALNYMECDLEYRLTPLPELLYSAKKYCSGSLQYFFNELAEMLRLNCGEDAQVCVNVALSKCKNLPNSCIDALTQLGGTLGNFGLTGQLESLRTVRINCEQVMAIKITDQDKRVRSYQTLGLCAGAALVILFI